MDLSYSNFIHHLREFGVLLKQTFTQWIDREPFNNSVIIAYYTIFSLPGLLIIIINMAGYFYDKEDIPSYHQGRNFLSKLLLVPVNLLFHMSKG